MTLKEIQETGEVIKSVIVDTNSNKSFFTSENGSIHPVNFKKPSQDYISAEEFDYQLEPTK